MLVASSGGSVAQLVQLMALLPTVAIGMLVAVRRPGNPLAWLIALVISWLVWLVVQVPKYRRSGGEQRLQLKWLYGGAAIFVACLTVGLVQPNDPGETWRVVSAVVAPGIAALPIALGIGILKFRLHEIDRVISRTLSYTLVTGMRRVQRIVDRRFNRAHYDAEANELAGAVQRAFEPAHVTVWLADRAR